MAVLAAPMGSLYWGNGKTIEARIGPPVYPIHYFQPVAQIATLQLLTYLELLVNTRPSVAYCTVKGAIATQLLRSER
jgi:hypothetical protein